MINHKGSLADNITNPVYTNPMSEKQNVQQVREATTSEAKQWACEHKNFMTPKIRSVKQVPKNPNFFVELSEGTDFEDRPMFGVSIIKWDSTEQKFTTNHEYNHLKQLVSSIYAAKNYMSNIIHELNSKAGKVEA